MQILCNVCLVLTGPAKVKLVKLESIDITTKVLAVSDRLDSLDHTVEEVGRQVLGDFSELHGLAGVGLTRTVTVKVW